MAAVALRAVVVAGAVVVVGAVAVAEAVVDDVDRQPDLPTKQVFEELHMKALLLPSDASSRSTLQARMTFCLAPLLLLVGCAGDPGVAPQSFENPEQAVRAFTVAVRDQDKPKLLAILGNEGKDIIDSGDTVADQQRRQKFLNLYEEKHTLVDDGENRKTLVVGNSDWPFPVPLVKDESGWSFDTPAGLDEILSRRIGENELSTIQVCKALGDAEQEYALRNPSRDGTNSYARKILSEPDKRDGLYWPTAEGEEPSPLGDLAARATAEGYRKRTQGPTPYHGYFFRILESQGPSAPDGALDYIVDGKMILGFAVLAYPADYGKSGIMTFIMSDDGVVYQKNLGDDTPTLAPAIKTFDPGEGWKKAE